MHFWVTVRKLNVTDRRTDRQTDGRTDGGRCNISRPGPSAPREIKTWASREMTAFLRHDVFLIDVMMNLFDTMKNFWTLWRAFEIMTNFCDVMTNCFTSWRVFDARTNFWRHDVILHHDELFGIMTYIWLHDKRLCVFHNFSYLDLWHISVIFLDNAGIIPGHLHISFVTIGPYLPSNITWIAQMSRSTKLWKTHNRWELGNDIS